MHETSLYYLHRAETWLFISTLFYFLMNGAGIFETVVLIPKWTKSPPQSLQLLNQIDLKTFWIVMHSIHDITFILAIIFCWEFELIRNSLIIFFSIH
ncbi:MAG: hypothetical protein EOP53_00425 [Sphingobacteriales bacterium]|nr:MAG: hypothetical protein EOP53_00425 [Sphingobacteriales bacterium]